MGIDLDRVRVRRGRGVIGCGMEETGHGAGVLLLGTDVVTPAGCGELVTAVPGGRLVAVGT